jgi:stage V sporulation protein SpoVS
MEKNQEKRDEFTSFVSSKSNAKRLSLYVYVSIVEKGAKEVRLRAIGAGAVNQAVKAYIISKGRCSVHGITPRLDVYFTDGEMTDISEDRGSVIEMKISV